MSTSIGIDLGTANAGSAVMRAGTPVVILSSEGECLVPSVVAVDKNHERLVGQGARNEGIVNPANTAFSIKRLMGRKAGDPEVESSRSRVPYHVGSGPAAFPSGNSTMELDASVHGSIDHV